MVRGTVSGKWGTVCGAIHGPRGTIFSAADGPGGPSFLPWTFRGGPILGGTNYRMTHGTAEFFVCAYYDSCA